MSRLAPRLTAILLAVQALLGALAAATAQETPAADAAFAFLVRQPARGRSVPILPANTLSSITARYDVGGEPVDVYVVPQLSDAGPERIDGAPAAPPVDWESVACAATPVQRFTRMPEGRPVFRTERRDYTVYIAGNLPGPVGCRFAAAFTETFEFFLEALRPTLDEGPPPEFPAVLELTQ